MKRSDIPALLAIVAFFVLICWAQDDDQRQNARDRELLAELAHVK